MRDGVAGREFRRGVCVGRIARAARGQQGFGFDPVFIDPASGRTFAEMSRTEKNALSHRGEALAQVRRFLNLANSAS